MERIWSLAMVLVALHLNNAGGMQVTSTGPQTIKKAEGESVTLGCTYSPGPSDTGELDIEWSNVSPDMTQKDELILSYSGGQEHKLGNPNLLKRLDFVGDPQNGDATIEISTLTMADTATYQCKVKQMPGVDSRKVTLVVLVRPTKPKCWVEGPEEKGGTVSLRCKSSKGSIPFTYQWTRESGGNMPAMSTQNPQTGELLISNHSESNTGNYRCQVTNEVGTEQCIYALKAYNPTNKAGVIAAGVIGAILLLLLLLLLIWLLICCCNKRRYEKEMANEIQEDAPAPESRPGSRLSSFRSVLGYRAHPGVFYSSVRNQPPHRTESGKSSVYHGQQPPAGNIYSAPLQYDSRYGYAV
ncbi:V-set and immunoglobulin domain-containing protein 8b isoform X2 [Denticeps clupeoides]|uniref:Ig-like domain-containing protein n=2 Tax=Denticeps clupeoides TaxID=299321 RepID=A0AAY4ECV8_9TELE|nr:coxsackievirus and adenovirus receptor homolog isoform X2 [Denticeps clupeoides]